MTENFNQQNDENQLVGIKMCKTEKDNAKSSQKVNKNQLTILLQKNNDILECFENNPVINFFVDIDNIPYNNKDQILQQFFEKLISINKLFENYTSEYRQKDNFYSCHLIFYDIHGKVSECKKLVQQLNQQQKIVELDIHPYSETKQLLRRVNQLKFSKKDSELKTDFKFNENNIQQFTIQRFDKCEENIHLLLQQPQQQTQKLQQQTQKLQQPIKQLPKNTKTDILEYILDNQKVQEVINKEGSSFNPRFRILQSIKNDLNDEDYFLYLLNCGRFPERDMGNVSVVEKYQQIQVNEKTPHVEGLISYFNQYYKTQLQFLQQQETNTTVQYSRKSLNSNFNQQTDLCIEQVLLTKYDNHEKLLIDLLQVIAFSKTVYFYRSRSENQIKIVISTKSEILQILEPYNFDKVFKDNLKLFDYPYGMTMFEDNENMIKIYSGLQYQECQNDEILAKWMWHFENIICSGDNDLIDIMKTYFAQMIQKPWIKTQIMPIITGDQGCGKNSLVNPFLQIFGIHAQQFTKLDQVFGKFNSSQLGMIFCCLNEIETENDKTHLQQMKNNITETYLSIERKGQDTFQVKNFANYIVLSNQSSPVYIEKNNRRMIQIDCSNQKYRDFKYFEDLYDSCIDCEFKEQNHYKDEFCSALLYYFNRYEINGKNLQQMIYVYDQKKTEVSDEFCINSAIQQKIDKLQVIDKFVLDNYSNLIKPFQYCDFDLLKDRSNQMKVSSLKYFKQEVKYINGKTQRVYILNEDNQNIQELKKFRKYLDQEEQINEKVIE